MLWAEGGGEAMATVVGGESVDVVPGWLQQYLKNQQAVKTESTQLLANKALDNAAFSKQSYQSYLSSNRAVLVTQFYGRLV
eukprot:SAG31_NODE_626_length_13460_cov_14.387517_8_plen_81_part_00